MFVHLSVTRFQDPLGQQNLEEESLVLGQLFLGRWGWDGEREELEERNSRREGGGEKREGRGPGAEGGSRKNRFSFMSTSSLGTSGKV